MKGQSLNAELVQLLTCTQPDDLSFLLVQLQVIVGHPVANPLNAASQAFHRVDVVTGWHAEVDLCVVSVRVTCETAFCYNVKQFSCEQQEQDGT